MSILPVTGWDYFLSVATPVARAPVGGRANRCGRVSRVQLRSGWRAPPGATPASHLLARACRLPGGRRPTHRLSVWAGARARGAMMPCVSLPLPPAAAVAPLASAWGGLLLLPFAAFAVARPRRGRPHAPAAAAAPHRLPVPVPAPVGGAGRGGATRGGRFKTAAELGWPLPTWGRQRPVLLAHPSRPPSVLVLPQHLDGHSAPLLLIFSTRRTLLPAVLARRRCSPNRIPRLARPGHIGVGNQRRLPLLPCRPCPPRRELAFTASRLSVSCTFICLISAGPVHRSTSSFGGTMVRVPKMRHRGFFFFSRPTGLVQRSDNVM